jgi:hypothetical protein
MVRLIKAPAYHILPTTGRNMDLDEAPTCDSVIQHIQRVCRQHYRTDDIPVIQSVFSDIVDLFEGKRSGYLGCDLHYHDFSHTLQTIVPFVEIMDGWNRNGKKPVVSREYFDLGIVAVLLHDTGYIKAAGDVEGTGAKYTFVHIQRSVEFAGSYLPTLRFGKHQIAAVQNAIRCTGIVFDKRVRFNSEEERIIGYGLGTADLLGQMSRSDYLKKLPILYREFEESYGYEGIDKLRKLGVRLFGSVEDLIRSTPYFFEAITMERFKMMGSVYTCLTDHFGSPGNPYMEAIEKNILRIRRSFPDIP